jgi:hypothetical protein
LFGADRVGRSVHHTLVLVAASVASRGKRMVSTDTLTRRPLSRRLMPKHRRHYRPIDLRPRFWCDCVGVRAVGEAGIRLAPLSTDYAWRKPEAQCRSEPR